MSETLHGAERPVDTDFRQALVVRTVWLRLMLVLLIVVVLAQTGYRFWLGGLFNPLAGIDGVRGQAAWDSGRATYLRIGDVADLFLFAAVLLSAISFLRWIAGAARVPPAVQFRNFTMNAGHAVLSCIMPITFFWAPPIIVASLINRLERRTRSGRAPRSRRAAVTVAMMVWWVGYLLCLVSGAALLSRPEAFLFRTVDERRSLDPIFEAPLSLLWAVVTVMSAVALIAILNGVVAHLRLGDGRRGPNVAEQE